ncbi:hypothetical protein M422DRAFT_221909 [Sphaerobolus stellatus SS14]|nr:hypothetical protein M422DRAFT_221909 [Sphaerobolus stellatus SS14]
MASRKAVPSLDVSPPAVQPNGTLDRSLFHREIPILAVRVNASKAGIFLRSAEMRGALLQVPKRKSVVPFQDNSDDKLVLLNTDDEGLLPEAAQNLISKEGLGLVPYTLELDYSYWNADEILDQILPPGLPEGTPTSFATAGHLAHLNLREEYAPYKYIIGQVILDKNSNIRTVVNKLQNIHTQYRYFDMEILAGEDNTIVEVHESGCKFEFDFRNVYWNSRLHHEHERLVSQFKPGEVIVDAFAGVGPFALPAAKRGCAVFANDLNPESFKWLKHNIERNRVETHVRAYCEDAADFIKRVVKMAWEDPFPYFGPPKTSAQRAKEVRVRKGKPPAPPGKGSRRISHYIMNLPDSAISFLGSFRGLFKELKDDPEFETVYDEMPLVHCYCFTRELEEKARKDILQRASESLGYPVPEDSAIHFVRRVAPSKDMHCLSFRLPREIAL